MKLRNTIVLIAVLTAISFNYSCRKCECEGEIPQISKEHRDLFTLKSDATINFIKNNTDTIVFYSNYYYLEERPRPGCVTILPRRSCICPSDYYVDESYSQRSEDNKLEFWMNASADELGSKFSYGFNYDAFDKFDSTNLTRTIHNSSVSGLKIKSYSDRLDSVNAIYYKDNVGLVLITYVNGDSVYRDGLY